MRGGLGFEEHLSDCDEARIPPGMAFTVSKIVRLSHYMDQLLPRGPEDGIRNQDKESE